MPTPAGPPLAAADLGQGAETPQLRSVGTFRARPVGTLVASCAYFNVPASQHSVGSKRPTLRRRFNVRLPGDVHS